MYLHRLGDLINHRTLRLGIRAHLLLQLHQPCVKLVLQSTAPLHQLLQLSSPHRQ
jgi:hypothetical protein